MLSLILIDGNKHILLDSMGDGVSRYVATLMDSGRHVDSVEYFETTQEADENVVKDAAYLLSVGYRLVP